MSDLPRPIRRTRHRRRPSSAPLVEGELDYSTSTHSHSSHSPHQHQHSTSAESMANWRIEPDVQPTPTPAPTSSPSPSSAAPPGSSSMMPSSYSELAEMHARSGGSSVFRPATVKERRAKKVANGSFSSPAPLNLTVPGASPASYGRAEPITPWEVREAECRTPITPRSGHRRAGSKWKGGPSTWAKRLAGRSSATSNDGHQSDAASLSPAVTSPASVGTLSPMEIRRAVQVQRPAMPATLIDAQSYQAHRRSRSDASAKAQAVEMQLRLLTIDRPPTPPPKSPIHHVAAAASTAAARNVESSTSAAWSSRPSFHSTHTSGGDSSSSEVRSTLSLISAPSSSAPSTPPTSYASPSLESYAKASRSTSGSGSGFFTDSPFPMSPFAPHLTSTGHGDDEEEEEEKEEIDVHPSTPHLVFDASRRSSSATSSSCCTGAGGTSSSSIGGGGGGGSSRDYGWRRSRSASRPQSRESSVAASGAAGLGGVVEPSGASWVAAGRASPPLSAHGSASSPRAAGFCTPPISPSLDMATRRFSATQYSTTTAAAAAAAQSPLYRTCSPPSSAQSHDAPSSAAQRSIHAMRSAAAEAASGRSTDSDLVKDALRLAPSCKRSGSWTLIEHATLSSASSTSASAGAGVVGGAWKHYQYAASTSCEELVTPPRPTRPRSNSNRRGIFSSSPFSSNDEHVKLAASPTLFISATPPKLPSPVDAHVSTALFSADALSATLHRTTSATLATTTHRPAPFAFRSVVGAQVVTTTSTMGQDLPSPSAAAAPSRLLSWIHHS